MAQTLNDFREFIVHRVSEGGKAMLGHFFGSWVANFNERWLKRRPHKNVASRQEHGSRDEHPLESAEKRTSMNQAIFEKDARFRPSLTVLDPRPHLDEGDLQQELESVVGQIMRSVGIRARVLGRDHLLQIALRVNEAAAREKDQGRPQLAEALCQRALDLFDKVVTQDHPLRTKILENYADLLHRIGRAQEAASLESEAAAIRNNRTDEEVFNSLLPQPDSWKRANSRDSGVLNSSFKKS
jgi:hypothetical protein